MPDSTHPQAAIAITQGDSAGVGPETIAKAFMEVPGDMRGCFVVGELQTLRRAAAVAAQARDGENAIPLPVAVIDSPAQLSQVPPNCIPLLELPGLPGPASWGQVDASAGEAAARCVVWAARAALRGEIAALVTAPLHKEALHAAGVDFPGHTELLQFEAAQHAGVCLDRMPVRMMLANDELRTVLVSIHTSLRKAIDAVTPGNLLQTLHITHEALSRSLGRAPRIGVAGLNPHAGEGGLFGSEEVEIIAPAIAQARAEGLDAHGPFAPDTVFMRARNAPGHPGEFDVVLAMYHDQGLIPVKYLGVEKGVNVTLGLPLVRTSPDHGTAFDIAGQGLAEAGSLIESVRMARKLAA
ncbi:MULTISPECIES: 4-hydroxythreonine-4-phosphate dehydrogenase PdxA [Delftia]|uniref:4-hydroxythreonine-4-phosphate dehydrogenase PdxA n=2 Tax=Delftia TaxID=80865 RepID=A0A7T2S2G6_DELAC|nr:MULTISPECIES: 4-hydroxythreonine-4-phosphate dehydrogenase PdxA [Delftia]MBB1650332.1 4-hydroxythreonine-4-phosphate dehydrogenase PdxA [Delftia sp. UME58]MBL8353539.1 4-hydroxythreonine-4-phosphate dehydrogenase PdxA [Delftia acidovorans]QPS07710.1 4-hydroxythreonine-4-phosphate dehydrogenase PdxA [Delftia acidovorans]